MRIAYLSSFYPLRGGIAQFNARLLQELGRSHDVKAWNFRRQYPGILFPGKTQLVGPGDEAVPVESEAVLDTLRPSTFIATARRIREWKPDLLLMKYWMSWFAPSLGYVARHCGCRSVAILDNVIPHEKRFFDLPLTRRFISSCTGFVTLSEAVSGDLSTIAPDAPRTVLPHPIYDHFGQAPGRAAALAALGLDEGKKTLLFFGLIRKYKGLDLLLDSFELLPSDYQLVIAGEPYGSFKPYSDRIASMAGKDRIRVFPEYIRDSEVKDFFGAADLVVLPYRSATQSGIGAIATHFETPMVATPVGALKEEIADRGLGLVCGSVDPASLAETIGQFFSSPGTAALCREAALREKERLGWPRFADNLIAFAETLCPKQ